MYVLLLEHSVKGTLLITYEADELEGHTGA